MMRDGAPGNGASAVMRLLASRRWRIWLLYAVVASILIALAPNFATRLNQIAILKATSTHLPSMIGFSLVLIVGQLDLSFAAVLTLGAMLCIGLQPALGWAGSTACAIAVGALIGLANGVLVVKARISSFIVTLGTMTMVQGVVNLYSKGGTLSLNDFTMADWLDPMSLLAPRVMICVALVLVAEVVLQRTPLGRGLFLLGGNSRAAWFSGLNVDLTVILAFVLSGALSAAGGVLFAMSLSSANPAMGTGSLMLVIASVIIGGASMNGGRGSIVQGAVAVLVLVTLTNGMSAMGAGFEVQLVASGVVLAVTVLLDAAVERRRDRRRGARAYLLRELESAGA